VALRHQVTLILPFTGFLTNLSQISQNNLTGDQQKQSFLNLIFSPGLNQGRFILPVTEHQPHS